jgi:RIO kinase 2
MRALSDFPVLRAIDWSRHSVVMSFVPGTLLNNIAILSHPEIAFARCIDIAVGLLRVGVIHADFTQFNVIVAEDESLTLIDLPQCIKHTHPEAQETFDRDVNQIRRFFELRFGFVAESVPSFAEFEGQIDPIDLFAKPKERAPAGEEEEDEEEDDEDGRVRARVSKENRFRRKLKRKPETKKMAHLKHEVKNWE